MGDDYHQSHFTGRNGDNRGIFQAGRWLNMSDVLDGTANTIMLGESEVEEAPDELKGEWP